MTEYVKGVPIDVIYAGGDAISRYVTMRQNGESPRMAEMLALRRPPQCVTDDTIFLGEKTGSQFAGCPQQGDQMARELRAKGGSPAGKVYKDSLARYPGDPEAWVSSASEIRSLCQRRGWTCDGAVKVTRNKDCIDNEPTYGVADDIIETEFRDILRENPEVAPTPKERERFRAELQERRSPSYATKGARKKKAKKTKLVSIGRK